MTPAPMTVRICHLYPRLLSVAGDRGNLFALTRRCAWRGIRCSVTEADVGEMPDFAQSDLILVQGGQDREMTVAASDLAAKAGPLREAIEADCVVIAVCAGYQLLGRHYIPADGPPMRGLGILDVVTEAGPARFIGHVAVDCDAGSGKPRQLTGFENHSGRTYLGGGVQPLGRVVAGGGNNGQDGTEGARYREVYATYLHGPVLPKNPWLADLLIARALAHRYGDVGPLAPLMDRVEDEAHAAAFRLARHRAGKWRAAAGAVSRLGRPWRAPAPATGATGATRVMEASEASEASEVTGAGRGASWTSH